MKKLLSILAIAGLMLSQVKPLQIHAQLPDGAYESCAFSLMINTAQSEDLYQYVLFLENATAQPLILNQPVFGWTANVGLTRVDYPSGTQIWAGSDHTKIVTTTLNITIPAGETVGVRYYFTGYASSVNATCLWSAIETPTATPTLAQTATPYGASTATATPIPTATPRPQVEVTAEVMMRAARAAITNTYGLDTVAPYDWHSSGRSFNFPNIFDSIVGPYMGQIFSYMLALMEIVNTNGVVMVIFVLSLGIAMLMIIIKIVSGGALSGWQSTGVKDTLNNPYRTVDRKGRR
jgi:hypothetical protein